MIQPEHVTEFMRDHVTQRVRERQRRNVRPPDAISYSVTQRTQEIGIRMALGATASQVRRGILWQTMRLVSMGVGIGAAASAVLSRLIAALLFETAPTDPSAFAGTVILLAGAALAAAIIPARRASRVDPMKALRPI